MTKFKISIDEIINYQNNKDLIWRNQAYFNNLYLMRSYALHVITTSFNYYTIDKKELDSILYIAFVDAITRFDVKQNKYNIDQALFLNIRSKVVKEIVKNIKSNHNDRILFKNLVNGPKLEQATNHRNKQSLENIFQCIEENCDPMLKSVIEMKLKGYSAKTIATLCGTTISKINNKIHSLYNLLRDQYND